MALRPDRALAEAARNAAAHPGTTLVLALVTLAMTATTLLTAGRASAAEREVLNSVDEAGPRLVVLTVSEPSPGIDAAGLVRLADVAQVQWVLGLGAARDVRAASGSRANVAARDLLTPLPAEVQVVLGRAPLPGEAVVGGRPQEALRLLEPAGAVLDAGRARAVVGRFTSSGAIADLDRLVLVQPEDPAAEPATLVYLLARNADDVAGIVEQVTALAGVDRDVLAIQTSPELVTLGQVLTGQLGALSRQLALGATAAGLVLVSLTMTLALTSRRRDYGRRRALGANRSALVALTLCEAAIPVLAGVALGTPLGLVVVARWTGTTPTATFVVADALLVILTGTAAAVPPAVAAATRDPMRILRVP